MFRSSSAHRAKGHAITSRCALRAHTSSVSQCYVAFRERSTATAPDRRLRRLRAMYQVDGTVPSVVLDAGSHTVKAGIAGEDLPHILLPSAVSVDCRGESGGGIPSGSTNGTLSKRVRAGFEAVTHRRDGVEIQPIFSETDGLISNWHNFETLLTHIFSSSLHVNPCDNALLYAEPNHNGKRERERLVELVFEKYEIPAVYLQRSAVLSAFANGRTTGVVLDVGHCGSSATPVVEGNLLNGMTLRTEMGGRALNDVLAKQLAEMNVKLRPVWSFRRSVVKSDDGNVKENSVEELQFPAMKQSFKQFAYVRLLEEVKMGLCRVHEAATQNPGVAPIGNSASAVVAAAASAGVAVAGNIATASTTAGVQMPRATYELPDGETISMGVERFSAAEHVLFGSLKHVSTRQAGDGRLSYVNQHLHGAGVAADGVNNASSNASGAGFSNGLHGLVMDAIKMCDSNLHRDIFAGVCLTGGTSDMPGLFERLSSGLLEKYYKTRVLAATGSHERKYCAWTGGSILATFAEFQKSWFSKSEYEENGVAFVHRKCP